MSHENLSSKKILICLPFFTLGGAETQAFLLAKYIKENTNANIEVWAFNKKGLLIDKLEAAKISWRLYPFDLSTLSQKGRFKKLKAIFKLGFAFRKARFDVLLPFTYYPNLLCTLASVFSKSKLCVWNQRGMETYLSVSNFEKLATLLKPKYIANSNACIEYISKRHNINTEKITLIKNGYSLLPVQNAKEYWRKRFNLTGNEVVLTMVANFYIEKDHITILAGLKKLISQNPTFKLKLILVGTGPNDLYENKAKAYAFDNQLHDNVVFLHSNADIAGILSVTDIGILSTSSEGCPNCVLEYMLSSLPVVATAIPAIEEIFQLENSYLFTLGDIEDFTLKISPLINDAELRASVGENNKNRVIANYDPSKMAFTYLDYISLHL
jgi:glycosyltransferase involved in cell wall biosynthesis